MKELEAAQEQLREESRKLGAIESRLKAIAASLPREGDPELQDAVTELRSVIDCVLLDSIGPAKRDLWAAAEYYSGKDKADAREEGEV